MQATPNTQAWSTSLLEHCHASVQKHLQPLMQKMFENSNMAFLEFAEKAQSSASQIQFMEALTIVQNNRAGVEEIFYCELGTRFSNFGSPSGHVAGTDENNSPLSLVSKEDTDIEVALKNMIDNAALGSAAELAGLRQRLAVLNNGKQLVGDDIPGGPGTLARAFDEAASSLVLEHQTRLLVFMLFDRFVIGNLHEMYVEYNDILVKAGILPNIRYEVRKNPVSGKQETVAADSPLPDQAETQAVPANRQAPASNQSLGDELFSNIMDLMASRQHADGTAPAPDSPAVTNPLPQGEIVTAITRIQQTAPVETVRAEQVIAIQPGSEDYRNISKSISDRLSTEREQVFKGVDRRRMPAADSQVIDLVGMMFDYLINDDDLPNVAKAELCRLHTPYLKIAIINRSIFSDDRHSAHRLLNRMASAATRWVFEDDLERGIFPAIRDVVQRVIDEFVNDVGLFDELLRGFESSLEELVGKAKALEERTRQAAAGKEKLAIARAQAAGAIEEHSQGHIVPSAIRRMMGDVWLDKLMFIYLREQDGDSSPAWRLAVRTIEDIIWTVEPRHSEDAKAELRARLPVLRKQIEQAFNDLAAYGASDSEAHLKLIADLQEEALNQPVHAPVERAEPDPAPETTEAAAEIDEEDEVLLSPAAEQALEQLKTVAFGTWFLIQERDDEHPIRVKLSWYSKMSGNFMFVDSMGVRSKVWQQNELAGLLADGKARMLGDSKSPFVMRALKTIRRMLGGDA